MFQTKYPALYALIALVAAAAVDSEQALSSSASLIAKLLGYENLIPEFVALAPQLGAISAEVKAMSPQDIEQAAEALVADLAFSSDKAKAVIAASFSVVDWLIAGQAPVMALVSAIKS
jgi:hypothetical protein